MGDNRQDQFECATNSFPQYQCDCGKFNTHFRVLLTRHVKEDHQIVCEEDDRPYICPCSLTTFSKYFILRHIFFDKCPAIEELKSETAKKTVYKRKRISAFHGQKRFKCEQCHFRARKSYHLANHIEMKHEGMSGIEWHRCKQCPKKFGNMEDLLSHVTRVHRRLSLRLSRNSDLNSSKSQIVWYKCKQCTKKFEVRIDLLAHVKRTHSNSCDQRSSKTVKKCDLAKPVVQKHHFEWHKCKQCPKKFKVRNEFLLHVKRVHSKHPPRYKCDICNFETNWRHRFGEHFIRKHAQLSEIQWQECKKCSKKFKVRGDLTKHMKKCTASISRKNNGLENLALQKCQEPKASKIKVEIIEPSKKKQGLKRKRSDQCCQHCSYRTKKSYNLSLHMLRVHTKLSNVQWHQCDHCPKVFKVKENLLTHVKYLHRNVIAKKSNVRKSQAEKKSKILRTKNDIVGKQKMIKQQTILHRCEYCDYKTDRRYRVTDHILRKHTDICDIQWHQCDQCPKKFKVVDDLRAHLKYKHSMNDQSEKKRTSLSQEVISRNSQIKDNTVVKQDNLKQTNLRHCKDCDFATTKSYNLSQHILQMHSKLPKFQWHQCNQCSKKYATKKSLTAHVKRVHSETIKIVQNYSSIVKVENDIFVKQENVNEQGRIERCQHCNFTTKRSYNLSQHIIRKHTKLSEIKWHQCHLCSRKFKVRDDLWAHVKGSHAKEYFTRKCQQCSFQTKIAEILEAHILQVHKSSSEVQGHTCKQCKKKYKSKTDLLKHVGSVHAKKIQWFKCEPCGFKSMHELKLKQHFLENHKK